MPDTPHAPDLELGPISGFRPSSHGRMHGISQEYYVVVEYGGDVLDGEGEEGEADLPGVREAACGEMSNP